MPPPSRDSTADGVSVITAGMNAGVQPRLVPSNQLAFAINVTNRGGLPRTRPVWRKVGLVYESEETQGLATEALFQCASYYQAVGQGENCLVASIGGRLFRYLVGSNNSVKDISIATDLNSSINPNCWMWQAEDFLIVQNGSAYPLFFDGASVRRSLGPEGQELPAGCMGTYVQGRVWMSLPNRISYMAGDLVYSHGYAGPYQGRQAVLQTTELTLFSGGSIFGVPVMAGPINAMASAAVADTSLGQGALQITTLTSFFSVRVPFDRALWFSSQDPLVVVSLPNYGAVGQKAITSVNGDLWYRSLDGLRSFQIGRRDLGTWVNTPLSVEVETIFRKDTQTLLSFESTVLFDNRLLTTCSPYGVLGRGVAHRGHVALDFNNISNLTTRSQPVYDGLWTGLRILQLVKGTFQNKERCFSFCLDADNNICLYELMPDGVGYFDNNGTADVATACSIETKALGWKDGGNILKKLCVADLYLDKIGGPGSGTVALDFKYRSDEDPTWVDWTDFTLCAPLKDCTTAGCPTFQNVREQYRTYIRLPNPADNCSQITRRMINTFYEAQIRMAWAGFLQLNRMHVWSRPLPDSVVSECPPVGSCILLTGCDLPWFDYDIESGGGGVISDMLGIVEEDTNIWITTEGGVVIRTEDQPQFP